MNFVFNDALQLSKLLMSKKNPSGKYSLGGKEVSYESLEEVFRNNVKDLVGTPQLWRENKNTFFSLVEQTLAAVQPKSVADAYGNFAEVITIAQGDTAVFTMRRGDMRAKQFVTQVAVAGRYEAFSLATDRFEVKTTAYGGAARIGIEEFLDQRIRWEDYLSIINEGMKEAVFKEVGRALQSAITQFPATNKVSAAAFDEAQFDRLIATVSVYGTPVIACTYEAAVTLVPANTAMSDAMRDERWEKGYFTRYKGTPVIVLPQSFTDESNRTKVIDPALIYIFSTNGPKPIKIVFEGQTLVEEFKNRDWSLELQTYQKFGVAIQTGGNIAVFKNTSLKLDNTPGTWN